MSKKQQQAKPTTRPTASSAVETPRTLAEPNEIYFEQPSDQDALYKKVFMGLSALIFVLMILFSFKSGINGDDSFQVDYSNKLMDYYSKGDTAALYIERGNVHNYGGFFDLIAGVTNKTLGYDENQVAYHSVRHFYSALFGFFAMLFAALFARDIAGWRAGLLTLVFMYLSPRFLGDSYMNPKDIPFAMGNMMAIYYMARMLRQMPKPSWGNVFGVAGGIGLAIASRAGGMLLIAYLALFSALDFYLRYGFKGLFERSSLIGKYAMYALIASVVGYFGALIFWPYGMQKPFSNPFEALSAFTKFGVQIRVLFEGGNVMSDETPWYYGLKWIWSTVPLFTLAGALLSLPFIVKLFKKYSPVPVYMAFFAAIFPAAYVIYKESVLYDGWRHLTFLYPTLVVVAALGWLALYDTFAAKKPMQYAVLALMGMGIGESAAFIARNYTMPYVYFNPLAGGMKAAYGNYETDYWGVSVKDGVDWMVEQGILGPNMKDTISIASSFSYNLEKYIKQYKAKVVYAKYARRYEYNWDYALFPSRFTYGAQLRTGKWPLKGQTLHTIEADGVPILAILKKNSDVPFQAVAAAKRGDLAGAITLDSAYVLQNPDDEVAWKELAGAYLNTRRMPELKNATDRLLALNPDDVDAMNYQGSYYMQSNDAANAMAIFEKSVVTSPDNHIGYYYMAYIKQAQKDFVGAADMITKCVKANGNFKPAYELGASIYQAQGDNAMAQQWQQAAASLK